MKCAKTTLEVCTFARLLWRAWLGSHRGRAPWHTIFRHGKSSVLYLSRTAAKLRGTFVWYIFVIRSFSASQKRPLSKVLRGAAALKIPPFEKGISSPVPAAADARYRSKGSVSFFGRPSIGNDKICEIARFA